MLVPAFDYNLDCEIPMGLATIGQFDGKHPAMACATTGGRVLIHQPYITKIEDDFDANGIKKVPTL
jgi:Bardet-Biedl syndrome 2 protein